MAWSSNPDKPQILGKYSLSQAALVTPPFCRNRCRSGRKRAERDTPSLAACLVRFHHNLNVAIEAGEKPDQPLDGIFSKAPFEHPRHLRLGYAHELTSLSLGELAFVGEPIDFRDDLSL